VVTISNILQTHLLGLKELAVGFQLEEKVGYIGKEHDNATCSGQLQF
jgi:hypothetical protein